MANKQDPFDRVVVAGLWAALALSVGVFLLFLFLRFTEHPEVMTWDWGEITAPLWAPALVGSALFLFVKAYL